MLADSLENPLGDAEIFDDSEQRYWTASSISGNFQIDGNCSSFTSNQPEDFGAIGNAGFVGSWMHAEIIPCADELPFLGLCGDLD